MPPTSPHHRAFFSNQPTIPTAGSRKGSASFLPRTDLSQGVYPPSIRPPCATLRHIYTTFPRYSWCGFVSARGFRRPSSLFSKDFLTRGNFFPKIWCEFWQGSRAFLACRTRGVGRFSSCFRPCLRPVLSDSQRKGLPVLGRSRAL